MSPALAGDSYDLAFSTYFGGSQWEHARDVYADVHGNAYVALQTSSTDYPVTRGVLQKVRGGGNTDCAVTKLSPTGALLASTYLGGSGTENADGVHVDSEGNVFLTGDTQSANFPVTARALQAQNHGGGEAFAIGARGALGPVTFLNGLIDELRLYNRPLTAQEIRTLHAASVSQR